MPLQTDVVQTQVGLPLIVTRLIDSVQRVTDNTAQSKSAATSKVIITIGAVAAGLIIVGKLVRKI